jgi:heme-degrading monooxygenase HmoA
MFARQVTLKLQSNKIQDARRVFNEQIAPELRKQPGNTEVYLLEPKTTNDEYISVSIWKNESDAEKYEKSGKFEELSGKIRPYMTGTLNVKRYEIQRQFH